MGHLALHRTRHETFSLTDAGGRLLVIAFYPGDWEPVSSAQLTLYQRQLPEFESLGAVLVGISVDSIWSHEMFAREHGIGFPLLADYQPKGAAARSYGVYDDVDGACGRALFVADGAGVIRWSNCYPANCNPGLDGILTALERLQAKWQRSPTPRVS
jgi:peroxiredoxin